MAGNLAIPADDGVLLNLHEGADPGTGADAAAIEVDQIGVVNDHGFIQLDIRGNHAHRPSGSSARRLPSSRLAGGSPIRMRFDCAPKLMVFAGSGKGKKTR
jgi:hypothetical protein